MKIMVCYDCFAEDKDILTSAAQFAKRCNASIDVVTSLQATSVTQEYWARKAAALQDDIVAFYRNQDIDCRPHATFAGPSHGEALLRYASEIGADLIIIWIKNKSKLGKLVFGSTAQQVILEANCPVLTFN